MALVQLDDSLSSVRSQIAPAIPTLTERSRENGVDRVEVFVDVMTDRVVLAVSHVLVTRREIDRGDWRRLVGPRIARATLSEIPQTAKEMRMQRRQMIARGEAARTQKAKRK